MDTQHKHNPCTASSSLPSITLAKPRGSARGAWLGLGASFTAGPLACSRQQNQFSIFVRVDVAVQQSTAGP
jgi:hypothetical protein